VLSGTSCACRPSTRRFSRSEGHVGGAIMGDPRCCRPVATLGGERAANRWYWPGSLSLGSRGASTLGGILSLAAERCWPGSRPRRAAHPEGHCRHHRAGVFHASQASQVVRLPRAASAVLNRSEQIRRSCSLVPRSRLGRVRPTWPLPEAPSGVVLFPAACREALVGRRSALRHRHAEHCLDEWKGNL